jgi:hypothetical protein
MGFGGINSRDLTREGKGLRLDGWQRIGVVLSVVWLLAGGFSGVIARSQELPSQAPQVKTEKQSELNGEGTGPPLFGYRLKVTDTLLVTVTFLFFAATLALAAFAKSWRREYRIELDDCWQIGTRNPSDDNCDWVSCLCRATATSCRCNGRAELSPEGCPACCGSSPP